MKPEHSETKAKTETETETSMINSIACESKTTYALLSNIYYIGYLK